MALKLDISRPSIIICLGGTGKKAGLQLKAKLLEKSRNDTLPDGVRFLFFDSDEEIPAVTYTSSDGTSKNAEIYISENVRGWNFDGTEWLIRKKKEDDENGTSSYSAFNKDLKPGYIRNGAGQRRMVGRLCFFFALNRFVQALEKQINDINSITASIKHAVDTGEPVNTLPNANIFIISSTGGGTGSGCFLDVAYIARHLSPPETNIQLILFLAETLPLYNELGIRYHHETNSYAALQEMEYFNLKQHFAFTYPTDPAPMHVECNEFPTDLTILVSNYTHHGKNIGDSTQVIKMTADMMHYYMTSSIQVDSYVDNIKRQNCFILPKNGRSRHYMTFGISRLALPKKELVSLAEHSNFNMVVNYLKSRRQNFNALKLVEDYLTDNGLNEFHTDDLINSILPDDNLRLGHPEQYMAGQDLTLENDELITLVNRIQGQIEDKLNDVKTVTDERKAQVFRENLQKLINANSEFEGDNRLSFAERLAWFQSITKAFRNSADLMEGEISSRCVIAASGLKFELNRAKENANKAWIRLNTLRRDYLDGERNIIKKFFSRIFPGLFERIEPGESEIVITELIKHKLNQYYYEMEINRRNHARKVFMELSKYTSNMVNRFQENQNQLDLKFSECEETGKSAWASLKQKNLYLDLNPISNDKITQVVNILCNLDPESVIDEALENVKLFGEKSIEPAAFTNTVMELISNKAHKVIDSLTMDQLFKNIVDKDGKTFVKREDVLGIMQKASTGLWPLESIAVEELRRTAPPYMTLVVTNAENNALAEKTDSLADASKMVVLEHPIDDEAVCITYEHSAALHMLSTIDSYRSSFETFRSEYGLTVVYVMGYEVTRELKEIEKIGTERRIRDLEMLIFGYVFGYVEVRGNWWYALTSEDMKKKIKSMPEALEFHTHGDEKLQIKIRRERMLGQSVQDSFDDIITSFNADFNRADIIEAKVNDYITLRGEETWGKLLYEKWMELDKSRTLRNVLERYCRRELSKEIHEFKPEEEQVNKENMNAEEPKEGAD